MASSPGTTFQFPTEKKIDFPSVVGSRIRHALEEVLPKGCKVQVSWAESSNSYVLSFASEDLNSVLLTQIVTNFLTHPSLTRVANRIPVIIFTLQNSTTTMTVHTNQGKFDGGLYTEPHSVDQTPPNDVTLSPTISCDENGLVRKMWYRSGVLHREGGAAVEESLSRWQGQKILADSPVAVFAEDHYSNQWYLNGEPYPGRKPYFIQAEKYEKEIRGPTSANPTLSRRHYVSVTLKWAKQASSGSDTPCPAFLRANHLWINSSGYIESAKDLEVHWSVGGIRYVTDQESLEKLIGLTHIAPFSDKFIPDASRELALLAELA